MPALVRRGCTVKELHRNWPVMASPAPSLYWCSVGCRRLRFPSSRRRCGPDGTGAGDPSQAVGGCAVFVRSGRRGGLCSFFDFAAGIGRTACRSARALLVHATPSLALARQSHHISRENARLSCKLDVLRANMCLERSDGGHPLAFRRVGEAMLYLLWRVHVTGQYLHECVPRGISASMQMKAFSCSVGFPPAKDTPNNSCYDFVVGVA